ncbi:MAG: hypothetical protein EAY65_04925 [Alphaproteobacteria bacterium]|nr:MAG: hypothetical protein EAY65_04925 [Alphaproteobacteria bacterium]
MTLYTAPLLPSGLQDSLTPATEYDRHVTNKLLDRFTLFGYAQVAPPLMEFEDTLLSGKGAAHQYNSFRVMDNASQRMMAVRADITPQIERIARSRLHQKDAPSVLRLSYAGQVLRVAPSGLSPKRQLRQAGIEMIGQRSHISSLEVLTAALESLELLGLNQLVVSFSLAGLFEALFHHCLPASQAIIHKAIIHKDMGSLPEAMPYKQQTLDLLHGTVVTDGLPASAQEMINHMCELQKEIQQRFAHVTFLYDPFDSLGFDYHEGVCFTLLDCATRQELARGGNYRLDHHISGCGVTFYVDRLIDTALNIPPSPPMQHLSATTSYAQGKAWRDEGTVTIHATQPTLASRVTFE